MIKFREAWDLVISFSFLVPRPIPTCKKKHGSWNKELDHGIQDSVAAEVLSTKKISNLSLDIYPILSHIRNVQCVLSVLQDG